MGTHLRVLSKSYTMNTNMTGFRGFSKIFVSLMAVALPLTDSLSPLSKVGVSDLGFGSVFFTGFLHQLQLTSHDLAAIWQEK